MRRRRSAKEEEEEEEGAHLEGPPGLQAEAPALLRAAERGAVHLAVAGGGVSPRWCFSSKGFSLNSVS